VAFTLVNLNTSPSWTGVSLNTSPSWTGVTLNTSPSWTGVSLNTSMIVNDWEDETRTWQQIGLLGKDSD